MKSNSIARIVGALVTMMLAGGAMAQVISGPIFNPSNDHTYYLLAPSTWTTAETEAEALGGHLATVRNSAEDAWIYSTFSTFGGQNRNLFIGLTTGNADGSVLSNYYWIDGETASYRNWYGPQPAESIEHYTQIIGPGNFASSGWNNISDVSSAGYSGTTVLPNDGVVEIVPEPACGVILIAGLTVCAVRKRFYRTMA